MKSDEVIREKVLDIAKQDNDVRAVIYTHDVPLKRYIHPIFYFIVNNLKKYDDDKMFENIIGERTVLFRGDKSYPEMHYGANAHLMIFKDGSTFAISVMTLKMFMERYNVYEKSKPFSKLLDKDGILPQFRNFDINKFIDDYRPTQDDFIKTCDEYFWVLQTFAEHIKSESLTASMFYLNISVRDMLNRMLRWYIGTKNDFSVSCGWLDGNFKKYFDADEYKLYEGTYPIADFEEIWKALYNVVNLYHRAGIAIAEYFGYTYPEQAEIDMLRIIENIKNV